MAENGRVISKPKPRPVPAYNGIKPVPVPVGKEPARLAKDLGEIDLTLDDSDEETDEEVMCPQLKSQGKHPAIARTRVSEAQTRSTPTKACSPSQEYLSEEFVRRLLGIPEENEMENSIEDMLRELEENANVPEGVNARNGVQFGQLLTPPPSLERKRRWDDELDYEELGPSHSNQFTETNKRVTQAHDKLKRPRMSTGGRQTSGEPGLVTRARAKQLGIPVMADPSDLPSDRQSKTPNQPRPKVLRGHGRENTERSGSQTDRIREEVMKLVESDRQRLNECQQRLGSWEMLLGLLDETMVDG